MSQNVARLKELLFENEAQALEDLSRRIDALADVDQRGREELRQVLQDVFERAGSTERLTASVADILDEALRRAEINKHSELSKSIAPAVVATVRSELRNSQDEMVEALYPIMGRLVKAYVASAIKDLSDQINRRLEQNPVMLRVQSLTTGRSMSELALAGTQDFELKELYLIRRGSGELLAHWPDSAINGREHVMSGVLAAVNEFANDAFAADQSSLRQIDLGDEQVYLRGSPLYLLAARCSGTAAQSIEQTLDDAFLAAIEQQQDITSGADHLDAHGHDAAAALASVGANLQAQIADQKAQLQRPAGAGALKTLAATILLPLAGWWGWTWYTDFEESRVRAAAEKTVTATSVMQGYPAQIDVSKRGRALTISGLAPSQDAKSQLLARLAKDLPNATVRDRLTVVPGSDIEIPDLMPEFAKIRRDVATLNAELAEQLTRSRITRDIERAERRISQASVDLSRASGFAVDRQQGDELQKSAVTLDVALAKLRSLRSSLGTADLALPAEQTAATLAQLTADLAAHGDQIVRSTGAAIASAPAKPDPAAGAGSKLDQIAERFAAEAERIAALSSAVSLTSAIKPPPPVVIAAPAPPPPAPLPAPEPTARERLEAWTHSKAIFFGNGSEYRDPATAARLIEELTSLVKASGLLVRIVGYTDFAGGQARNGPLAQERAERVRQDLLAVGAPPNLLAAVGRADLLDVSPVQGALSPNRRVEFEIGFDGEAAP